MKLVERERVEDESHDDGRDDREQHAEEQDLAASPVHGALEQQILLLGRGIDRDVAPALEGPQDGAQVGAGPEARSITALMAGPGSAAMARGQPAARSTTEGCVRPNSSPLAARAGPARSSRTDSPGSSNWMA